MKFRRSLTIFSVLLLAVVVLKGLTKKETLYQILRTSINQWHFNPRPIDDSFGADFLTFYLERLDPNKHYFLQSDIDEFMELSTVVDDEINEFDDTVFQTIDDRFIVRLKNLKALLANIFGEPLQFKKNEFIELDAKKKTNISNTRDLGQYWRRNVKYQVLNEYLSLIEDDLVSPTANVDLKQMDLALLNDALISVKKDTMSAIDRVLDQDVDERRHAYMNAIVSIFDAHSAFFPPDIKENFDISITGKLEGIGAVLREEKRKIKVVEIVPGSASWRQGQLEAEDVILKVGQNQDEPVSIVGMSVNDAVKLIRGKKGTMVRLTVKKSTGEVIVIPIIRDVVVIEETYAKGSVIKDSRSGHRYGYILLPKFYRDFKDSDARNTTDDIRKILTVFNREKVDGVVFDLRGNEGGALQDSVDTAGLFIQEGPIVQVLGKNNRKTIHYDDDASITYRGPLVIMIDSFSASASEILAAALQDYQRAIVVGESNTFGKGTVQYIVDFDRRFPSAFRYRPLGAMKLTIQKFYRVTGDSTQYKGVSPDILLPSRYGYLEVGEEYLTHSLPWDTIDAVDFNPWMGPLIQKEKIARQSRERVRQSEGFDQLKSYVSSVEKDRDDTQFPISFEQAVQRKKRIDQRSKSFKDGAISYDFLTINLVDYANPKKNYDPELEEAKKESRDEWKKELKEDVFIQESLSILNDMIEG